MDTGTGIPPEILGRVGSPFFTTKVGGSGLGLFLARRLVEGVGGGLRIHSDEKMTSCTVRLPRRRS
jgi:signal transduction histidine kinase